MVEQLREQLRESEIAKVRGLRTNDELTFEEIGAVLGVPTSTAFRLLNRPDYQFSELMLIRIRKGIARMKTTHRNRVSA